MSAQQTLWEAPLPRAGTLALAKCPAQGSPDGQAWTIYNDGRGGQYGVCHRCGERVVESPNDYGCWWEMEKHAKSCTGNRVSHLHGQMVCWSDGCGGAVGA